MAKPIFKSYSQVQEVLFPASLDVVYTDGTKIESRANRYTFVWRKSVEKHKAKLEEKIRKILDLVEEGRV